MEDDATDVDEVEIEVAEVNFEDMTPKERMRAEIDARRAKREKIRAERDAILARGLTPVLAFYKDAPEIIFNIRDGVSASVMRNFAVSVYNKYEMAVPKRTVEFVTSGTLRQFLRRHKRQHGDYSEKLLSLIVDSYNAYAELLSADSERNVSLSNICVEDLLNLAESENFSRYKYPTPKSLKELLSDPLGLHLLSTVSSRSLKFVLTLKPISDGALLYTKVHRNPEFKNIPFIESLHEELRKEFMVACKSKFQAELAMFALLSRYSTGENSLTRLMLEKKDSWSNPGSLESPGAIQEMWSVKTLTENPTLFRMAPGAIAYSDANFICVR